MDNYDRELEFAKDLSLKAGEIILKNFLHSTITVKSNLTPVTETDIAVSRMVIGTIKENFPDHQVLDEEIQNGKNDSEYVWVCDPIDGTIPFSHHIPTATFSLALCRNGETVVAVVYDPFIKRLLYTTEGGKSYMNDKVISVRKEPFKPGDLICGKPYWKEGVDPTTFIELLRKKQIRDYLTGSLVYEGMIVATGIMKGMITIGAHPWDRAAIKLIIENAGGKCTDEKGERMTVFGDPKFFVASNGLVHDELLEIINKSMKAYGKENKK